MYSFLVGLISVNIAVSHILLKLDSLGYIFVGDIIGLSLTT